LFNSYKLHLSKRKTKTNVSIVKATFLFYFILLFFFLDLKNKTLLGHCETNPLMQKKLLKEKSHKMQQHYFNKGIKR